jgi:aspartate/methionine/tyrosine aminotransferase
VKFSSSIDSPAKIFLRFPLGYKQSLHSLHVELSNQSPEERGVELPRASEKVSQIKPSAIRKMLDLSARMENVVHLEQGEPNFVTPQHILDAAVEAMRKGFTHYTDTSGTLELREAIAEKLEKENAIQVDPQTEVIVTSGSQEAMFAAALGFLDHGDEALVIEKIIYDNQKLVSIASLPGMEDRTITVQGFSKAYAMTGWRIGYMVAARNLSSTLRTLHYYAALCPNVISQKAAFAALTGPQKCVQEMLKEYKKRRELVLNELDKLKMLSYTQPKGAFYVFPDFSKLEKSDEKLATKILEKVRVVTVPGSGFGKAGQGHLRISYSPDYEQVKEGMKRIRNYVESRA